MICKQNNAKEQQQQQRQHHRALARNCKYLSILLKTETEERERERESVQNARNFSLAQHFMVMR